MAYTKNASKLVYTFIEERSNSGEWKPGDRIWTEKQLVEATGVSRVAVRQAVEKLIVQSRLYRVQGSGTYVLDTKGQEDLNLGLNHDIAYNDLLSILEFRRYYECATVALCIKYGSDEDIQEVEQQYRIMVQCGDDMEAFYTADYRFHDAIAKGTKKNFIFLISKALSKAMLLNQERLNYMIGPDVGLEYHPYILKYIKERDVELATLYMQKHMDASIQALENSIRKQQGGEP